MIGLETLVAAVIYIIIAGCIFGLLWWLIGFAQGQGMPEPFARVARIVLVVIAVLFAIGILLSLVGRPLVAW